MECAAAHSPIDRQTDRASPGWWNKDCHRGHVTHLTDGSVHDDEQHPVGRTVGLLTVCLRTTRSIITHTTEYRQPLSY